MAKRKQNQYNKVKILGGVGLILIVILIFLLIKWISEIVSNVGVIWLGVLIIIVIIGYGIYKYSKKEVVESDGFWSDRWVGIVGSGIAFSVVAFINKGDNGFTFVMAGFTSGCILGFVVNFISHLFGVITGKIIRKKSRFWATIKGKNDKNAPPLWIRILAEIIYAIPVLLAVAIAAVLFVFLDGGF